ncbi:MAG: glycoside hydrolase family 97 N-terminal domain-containing protein, partial [Prevotella sp.]|nr:glycoside hydrolase family 97 N-terminal domain-containing protein [Prevotella sp.]
MSLSFSLRHHLKSVITFSLLTIVSMSWGNDIKLTSPDGQMQVVVHGGKQRLTWEVSHSGTPVLAESEIGLNGPLKSMTSSTKSIQPSYISNRMMPDPFRTAIMRNKEFTVEFRVDNETAAYRISLNQRKTINVTEEISEWNFAGDFPAFVPYVNDNRGGERYSFSFESYYDEQRLSQMFADSLAINPLAVRLPDGQLAVVFDACAVDYPGMFLVKNSQTGQTGQTGRTSLKAAFAPVVTKETVAGHARLNLLPTERAKHIATINDNTIMPWRVIA